MGERATETLRRRQACGQALPCTGRRAFLRGAAALAVWSRMPRAAYAGTADPRFITVILRGAMDGLAVVPPVGDPGYRALRGDLAVGADGRGVLALDTTFALSAALPGIGARYKAGEAIIVHACATPYRDRSHFDGQDVLESGMAGPRAADTGWLNRVAAALPQGEKVRPAAGLAVSATVPLILRGGAPTLTWSPPGFKPAAGDTIMRLASLYGETDPQLARTLAAGIEVNRLAAGDTMPGQPGRAKGGLAASFRSVAEGAGKILSQEDGPRIAALSFDGWDTHADEGVGGGHLADQLAALDAAIEGLAGSLGPVWQNTVVAVVTEFGRTARPNGNEGTDHGTATTAFLVGGAVKGGRVVADWPGLRDADLFENRDLKPTTDLRAVLKGVLKDHLGLDDRRLATDIFPGSLAVPPLAGLLRTA